MRYLGGKFNLLKDIGNLIEQSAEKVSRIIDIFSGSGVVSSYFKSLGYEVIGNDSLYFAYVLSSGSTALDAIPAFEGLNVGAPLDYLNGLTLETSGLKLEDCFVYQNYSPHEDVKRMYFQNDNAIKIDLIRLTVEKWKNSGLINKDEYFYLLAAHCYRGSLRICCMPIRHTTPDNICQTTTFLRPSLDMIIHRFTA